jgi:Tfp pilus assembly protein PilP
MHPLLLPLLLAVGCVDDGGAEVSKARGAPSLGASSKIDDIKDGDVPTKAARATPKPAAAKPAGAGAATAAVEEEAVVVLPPRPPISLDGKSFQRRRDPFLSFSPGELVVPEPVRARGTDRKVEMQQYAFEDLKLIAIVNAGRGMTPRALFVASDGKSHSIEQGEYFSSAEVLLAAVNRDYVEVEVVDDDLASSLNLQRGERRALYLRNE